MLLLCLTLTPASGQTFSAGDLTHKSSGYQTRDGWVLDENGYVGAYFTAVEGRPVTINAQLSGQSSDGTAPRFNLVVADTKVGFSVPTSQIGFGHTFDLPSGTYFLRAELANDTPHTERSVTIDNLTIDGASGVSESTNRSVVEAKALATADTYIEHFRQGTTTLTLAGAQPGATATVRMQRNEFNFGTYVTGFNSSVWVGDLAPGETTTDRARYQDFVTQHFNMLVPSNMGKWQPTENTEGLPNMSHVDAIIDFANDNDMAFRQHNLA